MVSIYKNSKTETGLLSGLCFVAPGMGALVRVKVPRPTWSWERHSRTPKAAL